MKVLVIGSHVTGSPSMQRYSRLLADAYADPRSDAGPEFRSEFHCPPDVFTRFFTAWTGRKWAGYVDKFVLYPLRLLRLSRRFDVVHLADHSDASYLLLLSWFRPTVVTCHDLFAVAAALGEIPEWDPRSTGRIYQFLVRQGLKRASRIVAISEPSRQQAQRIIGTEISLLPNPLDPVFSTAAADPAARAADDRPPYALVVGGNGFRKRRDLALAAWRRLNEAEPDAPLELVFVGPPLDRIYEPSSPDEAVKVLHDISEAELVRLYANAAMLISMSRYEGFCWPIIESQVLGVAPLCADEAILRDTAGEAAVFVPADEIDSRPVDYWRSVRAELATDRLRKEAVSNVDRFSWERFVAGVHQHTTETLAATRR